MALPIKDTPVLEGEDAKRFVENMKNQRDSDTTYDEYKKASDLYHRLKEMNSSLVCD